MINWNLDVSELNRNLENVKNEIYKERRKLSLLCPKALNNSRNGHSWMSPDSIDLKRERTKDAIESLMKLKAEIIRRIDERSITKV